MKAHKGFFFSFEGNEGSGKSTQIALLAERLQQEGFVASQWREPGGTALGEALRPIIKQPGEELRMGPMAELLLMNASRAQLVEEVILPRLNQGEIILVDRFMIRRLSIRDWVVGSIGAWSGKRCPWRWELSLIHI